MYDAASDRQVCVGCKQSLTKDSYSPSHWGKKKVHVCRACLRSPQAKLNVRKHWLRNEYGLSLEGYETLLKKQNGVCAICHLPPEDGQRLHVDHNHITGKVRGLLCRHCNVGLGYFKEDPRLMSAAISYIGEHQE